MKRPRSRRGRPCFRCRRFVVPSFTPYPTSTACRSTFGAGLPWIPGSKASCSGDSAPAGRGVAGVRVGVAAAGALTAGRPAPATGVSLVPPETSTAMIGVPTSTVAPSSASSSATTPSYGEGSSTTALAVSISTITWLTLTESPGLTCQATMSASVRPSPTSGSLNCFTSDIFWPLSTRTCGRRRPAPGPGPADSGPPAGTGDRGRRTRRPAAPGPPAGRSTPR